MALPIPEPGLVIGYSYLWHHESLQGRVEGTKDRPCAIIVAHKDFKTLDACLRRHDELKL